jgi:hypothetical protein
MDRSASNVVTLPAGFPVGFTVAFEQMGTGQTSFAAGGGATLLSRGGVTAMAGQYAGASARVTSANTWLLTGDLV